MAGHRPDFEDRSRVKRQKMGMGLRKKFDDGVDPACESADEEDGGVPVPGPRLEKSVKVKEEVSIYSCRNVSFDAQICTSMDGLRLDFYGIADILMQNSRFLTATEEKIY